MDAPRYLPSEEIESQLAESIKRFDMNPRLIRDLSGIMGRRLWDDDTEVTDMAVQAAELALEDAGVDKEQVGLMINTSVTRNYVEPSVASLVHGDLGLPAHCLNFDVANACLGFVNGMQLAGNMIERGQIDYALVVNAESSNEIIENTIRRLTSPEVTEQEFRENFASLTLGSGAVAMVLANAEREANGHRVVGDFSQADTKHNRLCLGNMDKMVTDASNLLKAGIALVARTWPQFLEEVDWSPDSVDLFAVHQVSAPHTNKMAELIGIDKSKIYKIFTDYGNMGPVGIPVVLAKAREEGRLNQGDRVALFGVGSGLNCTMMAVEW
ncbi:MAG: 3-oxoacyl-ACP synthase III [Anaerolineae bacterium]